MTAGERANTERGIRAFEAQGGAELSSRHAQHGRGQKPAAVLTNMSFGRENHRNRRSTPRRRDDVSFQTIARNRPGGSGYDACDVADAGIRAPECADERAR